MASPDKKTHTLKRPLQRLYPLELPDRNTSSDERVEESPNESETKTQISTETQTTKITGGDIEQSGRPKRSGAKKARDNVRAITFHERDSDQN